MTHLADQDTRSPADSDGFYKRSANWGFLKTSAAMLLTFASGWFLLSNIFFRLDDAAFTFLVLGVFVGGGLFALTLLIRGILKWPVHPFSMGLWAAISLLWGMSIAVGLEFSFDLARGQAYLALVVPISAVFFLMGYRKLRHAQTEKLFLPYMLRVYAGIVTSALICRIFSPKQYTPGDGGEFEPLGILVPIVCLCVVFFYRGRWGRAAFWIVWPLSALILSWATTFFFYGLCGPIETHSACQRSDGSDELLTLLATFVGILILMVVVWIMEKIITTRGRVFDIRPIIKGEMVGGPLVQKLDRRVQWLLLDVFYVLAIGLLFVRSLPSDDETGLLVPTFRYSLLVEIAAGYAYFLTLAFIALSLALRLLLRRRFRLTHIVIGLAPALFVGAMLVTAIVTPILDVNSDVSFRITRAISALAIAVVLPIISVLYVSRRRFTWRQLRIVGLFIVGALLADIVFSFFIGQQAADRFNIGLSVGDVAALSVIIAAGGMFWRHRDEPSGFIVWPVTAFIAGILLRILVSAQGAINFADDRIATGWGEIFVSCIFGAAVAEVVILAKRVWYDKDPVARAEAVRVRGAVLIFYAIWPVLMLIFVLSSLHGFRLDIEDETAEISTEIDGFRLQAAQLALSVSTASTALEMELQKLNEDIEEIQSRVNFEAERIPAELQAIAADTAESVGRSLDKAKELGEAAIDDTIGEVTDTLAGAFTLPPIDLGFLGEIEFPDLGIGDAISGLFSGLFDFEFGFDEMLNQFVTTMMTTITAEFTGPLQQATEIKNRMEGHRDFVTGAVGNRIDGIMDVADKLREDAEDQFEAALDRAQRIIVQIVYIGYHLFVLIVMILLAVLGILAWKAIGGLIIMAGRIMTGWNMLTTGEEPVIPSRISGVEQ